MLLKVIEAKHIEDYQLQLKFNDGFEAIVDLKEKVYSDHRKIFHALQDVDYFKQFELDRWTIRWSNELDLAPEFLYDLAIAQEQSKVEL